MVKNESRKMISRMALAYDFDGTLARGNIQENSFIPSLGLEKDTFWPEVGKIAKAHQMDEILAYMFLLITKARDKQIIPYNRNAIRDHGKTVKYFAGVETWFERINDYAKRKGIVLEHYVISSGLLDMIKGTSIYNHFKVVYASSFKYDVNEIPEWPALAVNYTNKTQYLFRINKGVFNAWENEELNAYMEDNKRRILFPNMIYIGDGLTDVPAMKMINHKEGTSIGVYDKNNPKTKEAAKDLLGHKRVKYIAEANYCDGQDLDKIVKSIIDLVSIREQARA